MPRVVDQQVVCGFQLFAQPVEVVDDVRSRSVPQEDGLESVDLSEQRGDGFRVADRGHELSQLPVVVVSDYERPVATEIDMARNPDKGRVHRNAGAIRRTEENSTLADHHCQVQFFVTHDRREALVGEPGEPHGAGEQPDGHAPRSAIANAGEVARSEHQNVAHRAPILSATCPRCGADGARTSEGQDDREPDAREHAVAAARNARTRPGHAENDRPETFGRSMKIRAWASTGWRLPRRRGG
jgi:hypothetical protein